MCEKTTAFVSGLALALLGLAAVDSAEATSIKLYDGTTTKIITDGGALDSSPVEDVVMFKGTIGIWSLNVTTGLTTSDPTEPYLHLNSINKSSGAGTLTIWFSETGFGPSDTDLLAEAGGIVGGGSGSTVTYKTYQDLANTNYFDSGVPLTSQVYGTGSFSDTATGSLSDAAGPYSLTQMVTITHKQAGTTSLGVAVTVASVPDQGGTLALLGLSLIVLEGIRRRFALRRT